MVADWMSLFSELAYFSSLKLLYTQKKIYVSELTLFGNGIHMYLGIIAQESIYILAVLWA